MACQGVQSAERNSNAARADRRRRRSAWSSMMPDLAQRLRRAPVRPEPGSCAWGSPRRSWRMAPGTGMSRCRSSGQRPGWAQSVRTRSWRAGDDRAQFARQQPRLDTGRGHRRQQPRFLVVEIEVPGDRAGAVGSVGETVPRRWPGRSRSGWCAASRGSKGPALGGYGAEPDACLLACAAHRSSNRAGLSAVTRARRR